VIGVVKGVYERAGFEPLETPAFENIETLLGKYGDEGNKLIFKILRRGEHETSGDADLALRYDLTVPLARVVAQYQNELPKLFKRYQIQPVWRADRPARGRFREFYQCDIDAIGSTSPTVEADLLGAVCEVLTKLGFEKFTVRVNHRLVLSGLLNAAGIPGPLHGEALVAIDKLDKIGVEGVAAELGGRGVDSAASARCLAFFQGDADEGPARTLDRVAGLLGESDQSLANLSAIVSLTDSTPAAGRIRIDLSLARGLSYYTGAIMEIVVPDLAGSLGGGGRYDNLIGMFLGREVPACGFSLGLERIIVVMTERNMFPETVVGGAAEVMVAMWNDQSRGEALALAAELRRGGLRVDIYPESDKLGKQFKHASSRRFPFVAVIGDDERANDTVTVKDMQSGDQRPVPRQGVVDYIRRRAGTDRYS
jgi:histidyl-tRNA synthetase